MKFVICTLLFAFLVLFNSIELSSQSGEVGSGNPLELISIDLPNIPVGHYYTMPNGNVYRSRGTGEILVIYDEHNKRATVHQPGGDAVTLGPGPYGTRHHSEEFPVVQMNPVPRRLPPPPPPQHD